MPLINAEQIVIGLAKEDLFTREHAESGTTKDRADVRFEWMKTLAAMPLDHRILKRALRRKFGISAPRAAADWKRFVTALMRYNPNSLVTKARLALELDEERLQAGVELRGKGSEEDRDYKFAHRQALREETRRHHKLDQAEPAHHESHTSLLDADRGQSDLDAIREELLSRRPLTRARKEALLQRLEQAVLDDAARED